MKAETILELPAPCKCPDEEAVRNLMVAYIYGSCSLVQRLDFELHCLACNECLTTLAIIEDLLRSPVIEEEEKTLARSAAGREAAGIARRSWITEAPTSDSRGYLRKAA